MSNDPITTGFVATGVAIALYICLIFIRRARARPKPNAQVSKPQPSGGSEQALLVKITLSDEAFGEEQERDKIHRLGDALAGAIKESGAGEFDGDEFGNGVCTLYMYGPSASQLFDATIPILLSFRPSAGSFVIKRFGPPGAKEERIPIEHQQKVT